MKNLTLIRHGKSGYELGLSDKQRTLNERGIEQSIMVAEKYVEHLPQNYQIISSVAYRAKMTAEIFAKVFKFPVNEIQFSEDLYTFDGHELTSIIKSTNDNVTNLLIFGHNDAITHFVNKFGDINIDNVPTAGLVSIDFDTDIWSKINTGKTIHTLFPSKQ